MGIFDKNKFGSVKNDWSTPWEFFNPLMSEFNFTIDAAADTVNKKVDRFWDKSVDGLAQSWDNEVVWCNPPYGKDVPKWLEKGRSSNGISVFLIPAKTNTVWFHKLCLTASELRFVKGRPKFYNYENEDKEAVHGLPIPLALVIYRPNSDKCKVGAYDWR